MRRHLWAITFFIFAASCGDAPGRAPQLSTAEFGEDALARKLHLAHKDVTTTARMPRAGLVGDYNGDGYDDVAEVGGVWFGRSSFAASPTTWSPTGTVSDVTIDSQVMRAGDFNGDGYDDFIAVDGSKTYVYHGSTSGLATSPSATLSGVVHNYAVTDWNSDGYDDVWVVWKPLGDSVQRFMGAKTGLATTATATVTLGDATKHTVARQATGVYAGDFDQDGSSDDLVVEGDYAWNNAFSGVTRTTGWLLIWGGSAWTQSEIATSYRTVTSCYTTTQDEFVAGISRGSTAKDGDNCIVNHSSYSYSTGCHGAPGSSDYLTRYGGAHPSSWSTSSSGWPTKIGAPVLSGDLDDDGYIDYWSTNSAGDQTVINGEDGVRVKRYGSHPRYVGDFDGDGHDELLNPQWSTSVARYTEALPQTDDDGDGYYTPTDCDDSDSDIHPGAPDTWYDGVDSDCSGDSDYDQDRDGHDSDAYGGTDCDDEDRDIHPGATDYWYDGVDTDCAGNSDYDIDGDGFDVDKHGGQDCNDRNAGIHPDAEETWYDGVDGDCAGDSDYDRDQDGYDIERWGGTDCDDGDPSTFPGAPDLWYDGLDRDCRGNSDYDRDEDGFDAEAFGGTDCDDDAADVHPEVAETLGDGRDQDCDGREMCFADADEDGFRDATGRTVESLDEDCEDAGEAGRDDRDGDCDDADASAYPGAGEKIGDEVDQDCDGTEICYQDADGDGWRTAARVTSADADCADPGEADASAPHYDCADGDPSVYPTATEVVGDGVDQDCDGVDTTVRPPQASPPDSVASRSGCATAPAGSLPVLCMLGLLAARRRRDAPLPKNRAQRRDALR